MPHLFFIDTAHVDLAQMAVGILLAALITIISYHFKLLSFGGSVATFLLATIIYGIGGWVWTVPILTFFISSSLLSKIGKSKKKKFESIFAKTDRRDEGQVAANGGTAGILILLWFMYPESLEIYLLYTASLGAVAADTWATEIGTLAKRKPVSIISWKEVEPGTSGGVSCIGLIGGIAGAFLVICSAWLMQSGLFSFSIIVKLLTVSTIASLIDSIIGTTLQAKYKTEDGIVTEKTFYNEKPTAFIHGIRWINNDIVNWCCAISGVVVMYILM